MLNDVLQENEKNRIVSKKNRRALQALKNISDIYDQTKFKERYHFAKAFRNSGLTMNETRDIGFHISPHLWKTCISVTGERLKGGISLVFTLQLFTLLLLIW